MSPEWRLLRDGITDAHHHFAVEEAIVRRLDEAGSPNTLRIRQVENAVFVGVFQDTHSEVNLPFCKERGIKIVRRMNPGGAVYHDLGSFCYSAFFLRDAFPQPEEELYRLFAQPVIRTCRDYGVQAHFKPVNDVLVGERKIYGSAQVIWYRAFVQSGTFLVNIDFEVMDKALTPPPVKFADKKAKSIKERVTSLAREVGREIKTGEVIDRFLDHFSEILGIEFREEGLSEEERRLAEELWERKYATEEWNLGPSRTYGITLAGKSKGGVVSISANLDSGFIKELKIKGDFLLGRGETIGRLEKLLIGRSPAEASSLVEEVDLPPDLSRTLSQLLEELHE